MGGSPERRRRLARRLTIASAVLVVVCISILVVDHLVAAARAPVEVGRVDAYIDRVATDAAAAEPLHTERDRQTEVTLRRETRNVVLAWILLVSGGGLVAAGKWYRSLEPQPAPSLDELVDIRFPAGTPSGRSPTTTVEPSSETDPAIVDRWVEEFGRDREAAIPILQAIQSHFRYLPDDVLARVCETTDITPAQIAGTSSFYAQFRRSPVGRHLVRVCHGTACHVAGAGQITSELRRHLEIPEDGDTDPRNLFTIEPVACLGCCSLAPVMMVEDDTEGRLTPASARRALDDRVPRS